MHKFVSLKPKSAQTCKHNILEYSSSVSYSFIEKGSSKPGNFAELGEKFPNFTHLGMGEESSRRHAVLLCNTKASQYKKIFDLL